MIGWLSEINRLASKGKREDREPRDPPAAEPAGRATQTLSWPHPGHGAAPSPVRADSGF